METFKNNKLWKNGEVAIFFDGERPDTWTSVKDASMSLQGRDSCILETGWDDMEGCYLRLDYWAPYTHPMMVINGTQKLRFRPWRHPAQKETQTPSVIWYRVGSPPPAILTPPPVKNIHNRIKRQKKDLFDGGWEKNTTMKIAAGFDALFATLVPCGKIQRQYGRLAIRAVKHDLVVEILSWHFKETSREGTCAIPKIEFPGHLGGSDERERGRQLQLCKNLIRDGPPHIGVERLGKNYSQQEIYQVFEAVQDSKRLKTLDLRTCMQIDDMFREIPVTHEGRYMRASGKEMGANISPLVSALVSPTCTLTDLNLGGLKLTAASATLLASQIGLCESLERLGLRATGLSEECLLVLFGQGLPSNDNLKELDVSWNSFTPNVMRALCDGLSVNKTLEKLRAEHCKIDFDLVQMLSSALADFKGIRHLGLDGNDFAWTPLSGGDHGESLGAVSLVRGMKDNRSLLSIRVGECGMLSPVGRACCTGPTYDEHIGAFTRYELQTFSARNQKLQNEQQWLRMQTAVVSIANLLLRKMKENGN